MKNKIRFISFIVLSLCGLGAVSLYIGRPYFTRLRVNAAIENAKHPLSSIELLVALSPYDHGRDVLEALWTALVSNDQSQQEKAGYWLMMIANGNFPISHALGISEEEWLVELQLFLLQKRPTAQGQFQVEILSSLDILLPESERIDADKREI
jgi:hypothetical protein